MCAAIRSPAMQWLAQGKAKHNFGRDDLVLVGVAAGFFASRRMRKSTNQFCMDKNYFILSQRNLPIKSTSNSLRSNKKHFPKIRRATHSPHIDTNKPIQYSAINYIKCISFVSDKLRLTSYPFYPLFVYVCALFAWCLDGRTLFQTIWGIISDSGSAGEHYRQQSTSSTSFSRQPSYQQQQQQEHHHRQHHQTHQPKSSDRCDLHHRWHACPELLKAMDGVNYIADHTRKEEESTKVSICAHFPRSIEESGRERGREKKAPSSTISNSLASAATLCSLRHSIHVDNTVAHKLPLYASVCAHLQEFNKLRRAFFVRCSFQSPPE